MHSVAFFSSYMKYSAMAQPENGAMYCIGAGSEAEATTTIVYSIAPCSLSRSTTAPRTPERLPHAPHPRRPDWHVQHAAGAAHLVALAQLQVIAEDHGADVVLLEVQRLADPLVARLRGWELEHLARHGRREAVDARDAVLHLEHRADLPHVELGQVGRLDFFEEDLFQLAGSQDGIGGHGGTVRRL